MANYSFIGLDLSLSSTGCAAVSEDENPQARAILKVNLRDAQGAFIARHPEERVVFDNGATRNNCSLVSEKWRAYVAEYIEQLIDHVAAAPYADKIIGCVVSEGEEGLIARSLEKLNQLVVVFFLLPDKLALLVKAHHIAVYVCTHKNVTRLQYAVCERSA